eukprot:COSAG04_NODE_6674_length_1280_cov_1.177815_1_plen_240_part_01
MQGRLLHSAASTPVEIAPFSAIAGTALVPGAFAPEQLFIPRNDGRILAGDGRCLTTDGSSVSVAPCSRAAAQTWVGAYQNSTNEGMTSGIRIESLAHAGKCAEYSGTKVTLVACTKGPWTTGSSYAGAESFIHPTAQLKTHALTLSDPIPAAEVWAGPLQNGDVAVVLFNRALTDNVTRNISVDLHQLKHLPGAVHASSNATCASVRDIGRRRDLGAVCEPRTIHFMVEPRGAEMLRLTL